ncbi:glycosyltransferase [Cellulomonas sp. PhB143]|uniref:glycosyltransferase n=1 Tax=Cellulomonas sp. PhB143 TaxID=2485186 RepID=UPI000F463450|nr:glycosyltransferase [Cellulomonas sp. PhB143]ROS76973.1 glycosyl transferase family 2 [Cellulomonas sp. PhB143]
MRPDRPLVTAVVTVARPDARLGETLESLTRQLPDPGLLEVLLVDRTAPGTGPAAHGALGAPGQAGLPLLRRLDAHGLGPSAAHNLATAIATGRHLTYLGGDDVLAPGRLEVLAGVLTRLGCDFVRTDHARGDDAGVVHLRAPESRRGTALDPRGPLRAFPTRSTADLRSVEVGMFDARLADAGLLDLPDDLYWSAERPWTWRLHLRARAYAVVDAPEILLRRAQRPRSGDGAPEEGTDAAAGAPGRRPDLVAGLRRTLDVVLADPQAERFLPRLARELVDAVGQVLEPAHAAPRGARGARAGRDSAALERETRTLLESLPPAIVRDAVGGSSPACRSALHAVLPRRGATARHPRAAGPRLETHGTLDAALRAAR